MTKQFAMTTRKIVPTQRFLSLVLLVALKASNLHFASLSPKVFCLHLMQNFKVLVSRFRQSPARKIQNFPLASPRTGKLIKSGLLWCILIGCFNLRLALEAGCHPCENLIVPWYSEFQAKQQHVYEIKNLKIHHTMLKTCKRL